jgi:hypothetical protein
MKIGVGYFNLNFNCARKFQQLWIIQINLWIICSFKQYYRGKIVGKKRLEKLEYVW